MRQTRRDTDRLTVEDVRMIREAQRLRDLLRAIIRRRFSYSALAERFHLSEQSIYRIVSGDYKRDCRLKTCAPEVTRLRRKHARLMQAVNNTFSSKAIAARLGVHFQTVNAVLEFRSHRNVR